MIAKDKLTVFVGDNNIELSNVAKLSNKSAYLIDFTNYNNRISGTCYTSIADLPGLTEFATILRQATTIIYVAPEKWSDNKNNSKYSLQYWTEYYLNIFLLDKTKEIILPLEMMLLQPTDLSLMTRLNDNKKDNISQTVWVAGCSITAGVGVTENQRYGNLIADNLNLPVCSLGKAGSSIPYAVDQLLRSDINHGDIVILGLTSHNRITYYTPTKTDLVHVNVGRFALDSKLNKLIKLESLDDPTLIYSTVIAVYQIINFCRKIGAKLVVAGLLNQPEIAVYFANQPEYIHLHNYYGVEINELFIDLGSDGGHPGPLTHQWYANNILEKLKDS
jgi:hypothetical protein